MFQLSNTFQKIATVEKKEWNNPSSKTGNISKHNLFNEYEAALSLL